MKRTPEKHLTWLREGRTFEDIRRDLVAADKSEDELKEWMKLLDRP